MKRVVGTSERRTLAGEAVEAFVPESLPSRSPPIAMNATMVERLKRAEQALARLDLAGELVPSLDWFIYAFVRKEAVISSQIEGTQATLIDLLAQEAGERPRDDATAQEVQEVCNYLDALNYARAELNSPKGLPISIRLLNESHRRLMKGVRGATKQPGEVRKTQNWIGGTRPGSAMFVPPPPQALKRRLGDLEKFLHADSSLPALIRAGLAHVQFETIHPYLDGNGRIGRLLVTLLLEHWKLLSAPLLYLSLYLKRNRSEYYRLLNDVRRAGDWEAWLGFFLEGVAEIAEEAVSTARDLFALVNLDRQRLLALRNSSVMSLRLLELLPKHPLVTIPGAAKLLKTTKPTVGKAVAVLESLGILVETTGRQRDRTFSYAAYLDRLRIGTELGTDAPTGK
jgi:Fic family protein